MGDEKENQKDGVVISFNINKKDTRNYESDRVLLLANLALSKRDITLTDFILNEMGNILDKFFKDKKALLTIAFPDDADTFREITELLLVLEGHFENLIQFEGKNDFAISLILAHLVIILKKTISYEKIDEYSELLDFNKLRLLKNRIRGYLIKQKFPIDDFAFLEVKGKLQDAFNEHFGLIRNYSKEYIKLRKSIDEYGRSLKEEKFYFNTSLIKLDDMYTPQCIIPKQNNPRIISQQGAFLVFGFSNHKDSILDPPIQEETKLARKMQKITIDENSKGEILKELYRLGVSASIMFPEIESVTKEIKDRYAKD